MKRSNHALALTVALATVVICVSGCYTPPTESQLAASHPQREAYKRAHAEPVPQHLTAEAAKTFNEGKAYFIWLTEPELSLIRTRQVGTIEAHYAISPAKGALSLPEGMAWQLSKAYTKEGKVVVSDGFVQDLVANLRGGGTVQLYFGRAIGLGDKRDFARDEEQAFSNVLSVQIEAQ